MAGEGSREEFRVKVYRGIRDEASSSSSSSAPSCRVRVVERRPADGTEWSYELRPRPDLLAKPPAPFDWASDGSGVAHLAAALLADLGEAGAAMRAIVPSLRRLLSRLPAEGFEVSDSFLEAFAFAVAADVSPAPTPPSRPAPPDAAAPANPVAMGVAGNGG